MRWSAATSARRQRRARTTPTSRRRPGHKMPARQPPEENLETDPETVKAQLREIKTDMGICYVASFMIGGARSRVELHHPELCKHFF